MATRKHFVDFYSPGTFVSETSRRAIDSWDTGIAAALAADIKERHGAKPYGFYFVTLLVADPISDGEGGFLKVEGKEVERSGFFWLTGTILRYDDVPDASEFSILRANMKCNRDPICCENRNSYRHTGIFDVGHKIIDGSGNVIRSADDADLRAYRANKLAEWDEATSQLEPTP